MLVEEAIRILISKHPHFVQNRASALNLLFCVCGAGLEWVNGEIVDTIEDNYLNSTTPYVPPSAEEQIAGMEGVFKDNAPEWFEAHCAIIYAQVAEEEKKIQEILDNLDERCATGTMKSFYPLYDWPDWADKGWGRLCVPDDAKPDWIAAARETAEMIIRTDPDIVSCGNKNSATIKVAHMVLADLKCRFGVG